MRIVQLSKLPKETKLETAKGLVLDLLRTKKGFSINSDLNTPKSGYMVGGFGFHLTLTNDVNRTLLIMYIEKVLSEAKGNFYFGGWYDKDKNTFEVELSKNFKHKAPALLKAVILKQKAIYDVSNNKDIKV